jgi:site-specific recombinase XerD
MKRGEKMNDITTTKRNNEIQVVWHLPTIIEEWLRFLQTEYSEDTYRTYEYGFRRFRAWMEALGIYLLDLRRSDLVSYKKHLQAQKLSAASINLYMSAVKSWCTFLTDEYWYAYNPAWKLRNVRENYIGHKGDHITSENLWKLLESFGNSQIDRRDKVIITLAAWLGLRAVEISRAEYKDLETRGNRRIFHIRSKGANGSRDEWKALPTQVCAALDRWLEVRGHWEGPLFCNVGNRWGARIDRGTISERTTHRLRSLGINGRTSFHSLRHGAITEARKHTADVFELQKFSRHKDPSTLRHYDHTAEQLDNPLQDRLWSV